MHYQISQLDSGITVITDRMSSVKSISLGLWLNAGSRDEMPNELGISHFLEHMMFKGTPTRTPLDISMHFDRLGAELNAFTSKEYTCYYSRFTSDKLRDALSVLADMVVNSEFAEDAISLEREVVQEELARSIDSPDDYVFELFSQNIIKGHCVSRPILGTKESIASFSHQKCIDYVHKHYITGNLTVAAAGDVDHDLLVSLVNDLFSEMPHEKKSVRQLDNPRTFSGLFCETRPIEQAHIVYGFPGLPLGDEKRFALGILTTALGGSMSSRLFQEVRENRGLAYTIYATQGAYQGLGQWCVYAGTRPNNIQDVVGIIEQVLDNIANFGLSQDELQRTVELICGQMILGFETTTSHMMRIGKRDCLGAEQLSIDETIECYRKVSLEDIHALAQGCFSQKPTIAIVSPFTQEELCDMQLENL